MLTRRNRSAGVRAPASAESMRDMLIFPQHSVMPYDTKNSAPRAATLRRTVDGGWYEPPHERIRRLDASKWGNAGFLISMASIVEAMLVTVTRSCSSSRRAATESNRGRNTCRPPSSVTAYKANASTRWNMGAKCPQQSVWASRISLAALMAWAMICECRSATRLGFPVVPLV